LYFILACRIGAWQLFAGGINTFALLIFLILSIRLVRRGRIVPGIWLTVGGLGVASLLTELWISGLGVVLALSVALGILQITLQTLPERQLKWGATAGIAIGAVVLLVDILGPADRLPALPEMKTLVPFLAGVALVIFGWLLARQFFSYNLHTKLMIAFMVVSLTPLSVLIALRGHNLRTALLAKSEQALFATTLHIASSVDGFVTTNLYALRTEATLPALVNYLSLPATQRPGSAEETQAMAILDALAGRDEGNILSYALLDRQGQVVLDTVAENIGLDESRQDYVQTPLQTGQPYASSVACSPAVPEPVLHLSNVVQDEAGRSIGLLRVRYHAGVLRQLLTKHTNVAGSNSFVVLFDENYIYLVYGVAPEAISGELALPDPERLQTPQCAPGLPATGLSTNLSRLAQNAKLSEEPLFRTPDVTTDGKVSQVAVAKLEALPCLLAFFQSADADLAFIEAENRTMRVLAIIIAVLIAAAGLGVAQLLAAPLARLHEAATRIAAGDLAARAPVETSDEIGRLAIAFNYMTSQLYDLIGGLEQRVAERTHDLERQKQELARSNAELQQFAYVASHDLQEPLRMVTSYVQLLERRYRGQLDADADDFIAFAVDGAARMQQLIKGLLVYSRVGTHAQPLQSTDCQVVLARALTDLQVAMDESDAVVTHDPLPTVMADATQLGQLFQNLVGNAIKFRDNRCPEIHVGAERREDGYWLFSVRDNGIGVEPEYAERIFLIFQRLHTRDEYPGTGIGLAICKRIVERHGGRIWVASEPGQGATFYFTIPDQSVATHPTIGVGGGR
jgi:signal transduction histidine kinase